MKRSGPKYVFHGNRFWGGMEYGDFRRCDIATTEPGRPLLLKIRRFIGCLHVLRRWRRHPGVDDIIRCIRVPFAILICSKNTIGIVVLFLRIRSISPIELTHPEPLTPQVYWCFFDLAILL